MSQNDRQPAPAESPTDSHASARARVLESAERLFREYGYHKTTVADIARALGMSPANVYRFYDSKRAIFEAVAINLLHVVETALGKIVAMAAPAELRLRTFLETDRELSQQYFVGNSRIRDMVGVAISERWAAIDAHAEATRAMVEQIIRDGVAEGAFHTDDPATASACVMMSWLRFCHPLLIELPPLPHGPQPGQLADFIVSALTGGASAPASHNEDRTSQ